METAYFGIVIFLFLLAIVDLVVGVGNDAVNFLSSAVGAKAAPLRVIMLIAAAGVFLGAATSNGMMDIARHGIFLPEHYYFSEIMVILLAVVVSDVVLLDIFNSLGLPTSTTVSMVFELLGASFVLAIIKLNGNCMGLTFADLINTEKALSVIMGIFCSVAIAFIFGAFVQWFSRLLFTFTYDKNIGKKIGVFGGIAATTIIYFMLFKVILKASFMTADAKEWISDNQALLILLCFVSFTLVMQALHYMKVNVFKVVVLLGTFALAMAFAGNDLVNFIGVTLAGQASYMDYITNGIGVAPENFLMTSLNESAKTPIVYLLGAGAIMVITLAVNKKARKVLKTTVDLSRQDEGEEMFGSSSIARTIVRSSLNFSSAILSIIPEGIKEWVNRRFANDDSNIEEGKAFDMVRASVNLVLASLLISLGSSLKLPLSTTYVAFMVAMGSSLADRAWGRETAVYRVTGVISVIGGWFITAGAAFFLSGVVALIMYYGGIAAMVTMTLVAAFLLIRSNFSKHSSAKEPTFEKEQSYIIFNSENQTEVWDCITNHTKNNIYRNLQFAGDSYQQLYNAFCNEDNKALKTINNAITDQRKDFKKMRNIEIRGIIRIGNKVAFEKNTWYHLSSTCLQQMLGTLTRICEPIREHVANNFYPLPEDYRNEFQPYCHELCVCLDQMSSIIISDDYRSAESVSERSKALKQRFSQLRKIHLERMGKEKNNSITKVNLLYLNLIQESHELLSEARNVLRGSEHFFTKEELPQQNIELDTPEMMLA